MLKIVLLNKVIVAENRQRKTFSEPQIEQLAESIRARGLLHAPVVRENPDGSFTLVAGERRLRATNDLHSFGQLYTHNGVVIPDGMIPYTTLGQLSAGAAGARAAGRETGREALTQSS
jgi:hypothetical protein